MLNGRASPVFWEGDVKELSAVARRGEADEAHGGRRPVGAGEDSDSGDSLAGDPGQRLSRVQNNLNYFLAGSQAENSLANQVAEVGNEPPPGIGRAGVRGRRHKPARLLYKLRWTGRR